MSTLFTSQIVVDGKFTPDANRYHLYIGKSCPWASIAYSAYRIKGLDEVIGLSIVDPEMKDGYWQFDTGKEGTTKDNVHGFKSIKQLYDLADPNYAGKCTVPALYDTKLQTIVNNESHDILRIFNSQFNIAKYPNLDISPIAIRPLIDETNTQILSTSNPL